MAEKNRNQKSQKADQISIGNKQGTTQTGGANQAGQRPDNQRGEGSRDHGHKRGRKSRP
ncbi:MAG: hypothetical protein ACJ75B_05985 [Flavisolibacter sp.]